MIFIEMKIFFSFFIYLIIASFAGCVSTDSNFDKILTERDIKLRSYINAFEEKKENNTKVASTYYKKWRIEQFVWPLDIQSRISSFFKERRGRHRLHDGIDLACNTGTSVIASKSGIVVYAGDDMKGYGKTVVMKHTDGYATVYSHLSKLTIKTGELVQLGEELGKSGNTGFSTGPHLHFEIRLNAEPLDPVKTLAEIKSPNWQKNYLARSKKRSKPSKLYARNFSKKSKKSSKLYAYKKSENSPKQEKKAL